MSGHDWPQPNVLGCAARELEPGPASSGAAESWRPVASICSHTLRLSAAGENRYLSLLLLQVDFLPTELSGKSACRRPRFDSWVGNMPWRWDRLPTPVFLSFPCGSASPTVRETWVRSGLGRSRGEGKGYPVQYSGLENSINSIVHGLAKSWTRLSDFHFHDDYT